MELEARKAAAQSTDNDDEPKAAEGDTLWPSSLCALRAAGET
jgi:hypothetical protein